MDYTTLFCQIQEEPAPPFKRAPSLCEVCQQVEDGRKARGKRYDLASLLVVLVLAKLADMQSLLGAVNGFRISKCSCVQDCTCAGNACRVRILRLCPCSPRESTGECAFGGLVRAPGGSKPMRRRTEPFSATAERTACSFGD